MSKKSRKRNKKILAALALAGGAAMLAKGRGKGASAVTGVVNPNEATTGPFITKKADVVAPVIPSPDGSGGGGIHQGKTKPFQSKWHGVAPAPPGILNPYNKYQNIKGRLGARGAKGGRVAAKTGGRIRKQFGGALPVGGTARRDMRSGYYPSDMGMRGGPMYKKGGRVTGIAKRGFGRALMKGKK